MYLNRTQPTTRLRWNTIEDFAHNNATATDGEYTLRLRGVCGVALLEIRRGETLIWSGTTGQGIPTYARVFAEQKLAEVATA